MQNKLLLCERNCLENNSVDNFVENVMVQNYLVECNDSVQQVQTMIKEVLLILNYSYFEHYIDAKTIMDKLPISFVAKFKPEMIDKERQVYLTNWNKSRSSWWRRWLYDRKELKKNKQELEKNGYINYELSNWLYLLQDRTWFFYKFTKDKENSFIATFYAIDDFLANPFKLLFIHSGAKSLKPLDKNMNGLENNDFALC